MREETTEGENRAEIRRLKKKQCKFETGTFLKRKRKECFASGKRKKHARPNPEVSGAFP